MGNSKWEGGDIRCSKGYAIIYDASALAAVLSKIADTERAELSRLPAAARPTLRNDDQAKDDALGGIDSGRRNVTLTRYAGMFRRQGYDLDDLETMLTQENDEQCNPPLPASDVRAIAESIAKKAKGYPQTDAGNARLLSDRNRRDLRYDQKKKRWLIWSKKQKRWRVDNTNEVMRLAMAAASYRLVMASRMKDERARKAETLHSQHSHSRAALESAIKLSSALWPTWDDGLGWDADPNLIGVANGVIDEQGKLREGRREDRITMFSDVVFDAEATAPAFMKFLKRVQPDKELRLYLQRVAGYCLTGSIKEHALFFFYGKGANGKSTLLDLLSFIMGPYAASSGAACCAKLLMKKRDIDKAAIADIRS